MEDEKEIKKSKIAKIIISSEDELTDLLRKISNLQDPNILLTFAEESDILISPINFKVLQEVCDEMDKNLILQIIQNSNGVRNAKIAGSVITESPSEVDEALWLAAENQKRERKENLERALKGKPREVRDVIENLDQEKEPVLQDSEYQKRVQEVIEKAKNLTQRENPQIIQEDGVVFAIGEEIDAEPKRVEREKTNMLVGRNFSNVGELKNIKGDVDKRLPEREKPVEKIRLPRDRVKMKKKIIIFSIIFLVSLFLAGLLAYTTLPLVKANIYIESKAIEVEKVFKGNTGIKNFNVTEGEIPIKKEEITVDRSADDRTTGKGRRGTKAEGVVILKYWQGTATTIPAGTKITVDNLVFEFSTAVPLPEAPHTIQSVAVRAGEPGPEYNLSSGKLFTVEGFSKEKLTAENNVPFTGGKSEEYSMFTQEDYSRLFEKLKTEAFADGKKQLENKNPDWELIEGTITQVVDGSPRTDIAIGGEASMFNMSISTKTEALFFNKNEILQAREEIIKKAAVEEGLFESDGELNLELDREIETEITIETIEGHNVTVKFRAKGNIRAKVDTEEIEKSLLGKSWKEGSEILEKIKYSDKETKIKFYPEYFPEFLRYFPKRQGRVIVETQLVETEIIKEVEEDKETIEES